MKGVPVAAPFFIQKAVGKFGENFRDYNQNKGSTFKNKHLIESDKIGLVITLGLKGL
jgi:hypothetical protein